jgi:regulation of enolase protein 1 (concanavalin A-like superfamily)
MSPAGKDIRWLEPRCSNCEYDVGELEGDTATDSWRRGFTFSNWKRKIAIQVQYNDKTHTAARIQLARRYNDFFDSIVRLCYCDLLYQLKTAIMANPNPDPDYSSMSVSCKPKLG